MTHYTRAEWGARPPEATYELDPAEVVGTALHWPAMDKPVTTVAAAMEKLRGWQDYHMDTLGWSDIGYQLAFDQLGNVYRLRGMTHRSGANGDRHVNERFGAFLLILAPGEQPTPAMVRRVRRYVRVWRRIFPRATRIVGHNDIRPEPTACPGPIVSRMIDRRTFEPRLLGLP
jgi:N-acetylmuramoyl-L-alanine amidase